MPVPQLPGDRAAKTDLREQLMARRRGLAPADLERAARALAARVVDLAEVWRGARVAAYVSVGAEPDTSSLLTTLAEQGDVLLPVLLDDGDLDWAAYAGDRHLERAGRGLRQPTAPRRGVDAIAAVDVVLVPGLAVSSRGDRLGRGGGSYDRALARVPAGTPVVCLLHDGELDQPVPVEAHDRRVSMAVTPGRVVRF